jgi:hypothetical protein
VERLLRKHLKSLNVRVSLYMVHLAPPG